MMLVVTIKREYAEEIARVQSFFDQHRVALAQRFLMFGRNGLDEDLYSEYFYYGTPENGIYASMDDIVSYIQRYGGDSSAVLSIGPLCLQTWNRMLGADDSRTHKRDDIQIKWAGIKKKESFSYEETGGQEECRVYGMPGMCPSLLRSFL